jgi:hypothetical protein
VRYGVWRFDIALDFVLAIWDFLSFAHSKPWC